MRQMSPNEILVPDLCFSGFIVCIFLSLCRGYTLITHAHTYAYPRSSRVLLSSFPQFTLRFVFPFYRGDDESVELKVKLQNWLKVFSSHKEKDPKTQRSALKLPGGFSQSLQRP